MSKHRESIASKKFLILTQFCCTWNHRWTLIDTVYQLTYPTGSISVKTFKCYNFAYNLFYLFVNSEEKENSANNCLAISHGQFGTIQGVPLTKNTSNCFEDKNCFIASQREKKLKCHGNG